MSEEHGEGNGWIALTGGLGSTACEQRVTKFGCLKVH